MRVTITALTCVCLIMLTSAAPAKEKKHDKQMDQQAMMEVWKQIGTPGEPHKLFASLAGSWTTTSKEWMEPGKPPTESTGTAEMKMLLDGRFLYQEYHAQMMGQPFSGIGIDGYDNMLARAEQLIGGAGERVLLGTWSNESERLAGAVAEAQARGVQVVVLCIQGCGHECGNCRGDVYRYAVAGDASTRWLMVVVDDRELLVGEVSQGGDAKAAQTTLEVLVAMTAQYLRNTIAVAEIVRSVGSRLPKVLDAPALRAVQGAGLAEDGDSWLKRLSTVVRRSRV